MLPEGEVPRLLGVGVDGRSLFFGGVGVRPLRPFFSRERPLSGLSLFFGEGDLALPSLPFLPLPLPLLLALAFTWPFSSPVLLHQDRFSCVWLAAQGHLGPAAQSPVLHHFVQKPDLALTLSALLSTAALTLGPLLLDAREAWFFLRSVSSR